MTRLSSTTLFAMPLAWVALAFAPAHAQPGLTEAQARAAVAPFYEALNAAPGKDAGALVLQATADGWQSCGGNDDCKSREDVAKAIAGFGQRVPNLKWVIKEVIVRGKQVVVRGEGSGTPSGDFMGVPHAGKSFQILAIDIHTVENGKMVGKTYHVEDWMGAARQLRAPN
jgi:predicted ester cyclase